MPVGNMQYRIATENKERKARNAANSDSICDNNMHGTGENGVTRIGGAKGYNTDTENVIVPWDVVNVLKIACQKCTGIVAETLQQKAKDRKRLKKAPL